MVENKKKSQPKLGPFVYCCKLRWAQLLLHGFETLGEHGDNLVEVANDAEVGNAEDGGELIFVDGNDELALFHAGEVLDGTADAASHIEVGTDGLTGLSDLTAGIHHASIHHSTAAGDFATKLEISEEEKEFRMTRPAFGGNLMATILCKNNRPQMSTVRPGVMQKLTPDPTRKGEIVDYKVAFDDAKISRVKVVKTVKEEKVITDISQAKILVSGGRGVGTKDGFSKLEALAKELGGEVSSSRAMVDAGVMDQSRQVGQTGKTVRPNLYLACGISGAIQHLAGMEESDLIIAINKDKFAPIFSVADLGIVGDLHKIVPMLTERLKSMQK